VQINSNFFGRTVKRSGWSGRPELFENQLTCCEVRKVNNDDDDDDDDDNKNNNKF
jgi:hypothetical protein